MRHSLSPFAVLACLAATACTDDHTTIWIAQVSAPSFDEGCTTSGVALLNSTWDPMSGSSYSQFLLIQNAIRSNASDIANDSNWVQIEGIEVTLTDAVSGNELTPPYSIPVGGTIPSATGPSSFGEATVSAIIIPASKADAVEAAMGLVVAEIVPFGRTFGGLEVEGRPFTWPIQIVIGGAASCTVCPDEANALDQCSPGQDGACTVLAANDMACATP